MRKYFILATTSLIASLVCISGMAYAEEDYIIPPEYARTTEEPTDGSEDVNYDSEVMPINADEESVPVETSDETELESDIDEVNQTIIEDEATEAEAEEEDSEPALWPMWLSFGAIGVMVILIIILNLCGRKYRKK